MQGVITTRRDIRELEKDIYRLYEEIKHTMYEMYETLKELEKLEKLAEKSLIGKETPQEIANRLAEMMYQLYEMGFHLKGESFERFVKRTVKELEKEYKARQMEKNIEVIRKTIYELLELYEKLKASEGNFVRQEIVNKLTDKIINKLHVLYEIGFHSEGESFQKFAKRIFKLLDSLYEARKIMYELLESYEKRLKEEFSEELITEFVNEFRKLYGKRLKQKPSEEIITWIIYMLQVWHESYEKEKEKEGEKGKIGKNFKEFIISHFTSLLISHFWRLDIENIAYKNEIGSFITKTELNFYLKDDI